MFPISCAICDAEEQSLDHLIHHIRVYHKKIFNQAVSMKQVPAKEDIAAATLKYIDQVAPDLARCHPCSTIFSSKWMLQRHVRQFHQETFQCQNCPKIFTDEKKMRKHEAKFHKREVLERQRVQEEEEEELEVIEVSTDFADGEEEDKENIMKEPSPKKGGSKKKPKKISGKKYLSPVSLDNNLPEEKSESEPNLSTLPKSVTVVQCATSSGPSPHRGFGQQLGQKNINVPSSSPGSLLNLNTVSRTNEINFNKTKSSDAIGQQSVSTKSGGVYQHQKVQWLKYSDIIKQQLTNKGNVRKPIPQAKITPKQKLTNINYTSMLSDIYQRQLAKQNVPMNENFIRTYSNKHQASKSNALKQQEKMGFNHLEQLPKATDISRNYPSKGIGQIRRPKTNETTKHLPLNLTRPQYSNVTFTQLQKTSDVTEKQLTNTKEQLTNITDVTMKQMPENTDAKVNVPISSEEKTENLANNRARKSAFVLNCTKCGLAFPNATHLINHIRSAHVL